MRSEKGFAHFLLLFLLLAGIGIGTYLVQTRTNLLPKAFFGDPCSPPIENPIVCENSKPGNPFSEWGIGFGDPNIEGFSTNVSYNKGQTAEFKIKTASNAYHIDIYRTGYYNNLGARKVATIQPSVALPQTQPACKTDPETSLYDCGNWAVSASWQIPADAVSGVYLAKLVRDDTQSQGNHITFVVRDDERRSDILFQTSDTTGQAYNNYGGASLYPQVLNGPRGKKVSFNRPMASSPAVTLNFLYQIYELPMTKFLEANGYDVTYFSGVDTDRYGDLVKNHKLFMSVGHDEYWSGKQRDKVEEARDSGVNLAFFSSNEMFWKTRYEKSIDGNNTDYRTMVSYKETYEGTKTDPLPGVWTGTWRDPRFRSTTDGVTPENALTGQLFMVNGYNLDSITVPAEDGKMRFWRNTPIADLTEGQSVILPAGTLGFEWDIDADNGFRPDGVIKLSRSTYDKPMVLSDYGITFPPGQATHSLTLYKHSSGALVFGAGTLGLQYGLADNKEINAIMPEQYRATDIEDNRIKQVIVNLLADMGIQPADLSSGLIPAQASTDTTPPTVTIVSPTSNSAVAAGFMVMGTASDSGGSNPAGVVGAVEVSYDGGKTWHPAVGRTNWTYTIPENAGENLQLKVRAVDDSGNISDAYGINQSSSQCTSGDVTVSSTSGSVGSTTTFTADSNCNGTPEYRWWVQTPATEITPVNWVMKKDWDTDKTFSWDTAGSPAGDYLVSAWIRVKGSSNNSEIFDISPYTNFKLTANQAACDSAEITPETETPGGVHSFQGSSNCGTDAQYRWWILPPGGTWQLVQDFSSSTTFDWNAAGKAPGNYKVGVHARTADGSKTFSGAPAFDFTVANTPSPSPSQTPSPCNQASLSASSTSPKPKGGTYKFTGNSNCGAGVQYRYWVLSPSAGWQLKQDWTSSTTFNWNTSGLSSGTYLIGIHAKSTAGTTFTSAPALPFTLN